MKPTEFRKIMRSVLASEFKTYGFKRGSNSNWVKPCDEDYLLIWFHLSRGGFDYELGSEFTMEFRISPLDHFGQVSLPAICTHRRLPELLTEEELERVRILQNDVRAKLEQPSASHWIYKCSQGARGHVLGKLEAIRAWEGPNYKNLIWFQFKTEDDVMMWARFIKDVLPGVIARVGQEHQNKKSINC